MYYIHFCYTFSQPAEVTIGIWKSVYQWWVCVKSDVKQIIAHNFNKLQRKKNVLLIRDKVPWMREVETNSRVHNKVCTTNLIKIKTM